VASVSVLEVWRKTYSLLFSARNYTYWHNLSKWFSDQFYFTKTIATMQKESDTKV